MNWTRRVLRLVLVGHDASRAERSRAVARDAPRGPAAALPADSRGARRGQVAELAASARERSATLQSDLTERERSDARRAFEAESPYAAPSPVEGGWPAGDAGASPAPPPFVLNGHAASLTPY
jgi:hypothetical protein